MMFQRVIPRADELWVTPDESGIRCFMSPPVNGTEIVGIQFNDPQAGPISFVMAVEAVPIVIEELAAVLDNITGLRDRIRNNQKEGNTDE